MAQNENLFDLTSNLECAFARWEHLNEHGGSDPNWSDGNNMNTVRNHIIYWKYQIEKFIKSQEETTLFGSEYPEVYYKPTPNVVSSKYMAKETEIRRRAVEQLALYEQDPNFCYVRDHFKDVFPKGETRETRAFSLPYYAAAGLKGYRECVENDDLVAMRRNFYTSYEVKAPYWAKYAVQFKDYLSREHDTSPIDDYELEDEYEEDIENFDIAGPTSKSKSSLDALIHKASEKSSTQQSNKKTQEIQLSLF